MTSSPTFTGTPAAEQQETSVAARLRAAGFLSASSIMVMVLLRADAAAKAFAPLTSTGEDAFHRSALARSVRS